MSASPYPDAPPPPELPLLDSGSPPPALRPVVGLLLIQASPYPLWMRGEQLAQAVVLAALLYFVLRPEVSGHFAAGLPGRDVRRWRH